jgi:hypothetical protein
MEFVKNERKLVKLEYGTLGNRITFEYTNSQAQGGTGEKVVQLRPEVTFFYSK